MSTPTYPFQEEMTNKEWANLFNTVEGKTHKLTAKATPFTPMKTKTKKKLTPLQRIKAKAFFKGRESIQLPYEQMLTGEKELNKSLRSELEVAKAKVAALSAILQSIHTSAQAGADILRVK